MQHTARLRHAHLAQHVVRIHVRGTPLVRVFVTQMQLYRHVAAHGDLELACHAVDLHAVRRRRDVVVIVHVVVQADLANTDA